MSKKRDLKARIAKLEAENAELRRKLDLERQITQMVRIIQEPEGTVTIKSPEHLSYIYEHKPGDTFPMWPDYLGWIS